MRGSLVLLLLTCSASCCGVVAGSVCPDGVNITVVYNCIIWPDQDWRLIITEQLQNLVSVGLAECANVHVVMSIPSIHAEHSYEGLELLLADGRQIVASVLPPRRSRYTAGTVVSQIHENSFEYPGLHLTWLLAQVRQVARMCHPFGYIITCSNTYSAVAGSAASKCQKCHVFVLPLKRYGQPRSPDSSSSRRRSLVQCYHCPLASSHGSISL